MQDIEVFDLVIILITLLLGLKGLFRGLIKESLSKVSGNGEAL